MAIGNWIIKVNLREGLSAFGCGHISYFLNNEITLNTDIRRLLKIRWDKLQFSVKRILNYIWKSSVLFIILTDCCSKEYASAKFFFIFFFLGPLLQHMEFPRWGVKLGQQLLAYATAIAAQDRSHICDPHHSSQQCQIFNTLSEARDWTSILMDPSCDH